MTTHLLALLAGLVVGGLTFVRLYRAQRDEGCPA
jgi:hypothetical protein